MTHNVEYMNIFRNITLVCRHPRALVLIQLILHIYRLHVFLKFHFPLFHVLREVLYFGSVQRHWCRAICSFNLSHSHYKLPFIMSHYTVYILSYSTGICLIIGIAYVPNIVPLNYEFFKVRALSMGSRGPTETCTIPDKVRCIGEAVMTAP